MTHQEVVRDKIKQYKKCFEQKTDISAGQLITFGQFVFVAVEGLRHQLTWGTYGPRLKKTVVPLTHWLFLVTLFFIVSLLNNIALGYNISVPLHIIFRSGGLIVNMILGTLILGKRYVYLIF